jgi:hypothetical protein
MLDWHAKNIMGSLRSRVSEWKRTLEMAIEREFPNGLKDPGLSLISNNGSQPLRVHMKNIATSGKLNISFL